MLALSPYSTAAQAPAGAVTSEVTSPEAVLGVQMGTNRRALNAYLVERGWVLVADSIVTVGSPSLHSGTLAGRPAEVIATFSTSTKRLLNLAINIPAASAEELRSAYADVYRLMVRTRCAPTVAPDYIAQRDSILGGTVPYLPAAGSVETFKPLLPGHTTLVPAENTDWPRPRWSNADAQVGTQLTASRLDKESRWPYQATLWSSVAMIGRQTMCADARAAEDSAALAYRAARIASRRVRKPGDAPVIDSVIVVAGPGVTLRVGTLVVRGTEDEPEGVAGILRKPVGSTVHYDARVDPAYESLKVFAADSASAVKGTILLDETRMIMGTAQLRPRPETNRLYELLRAELTSKTPLVAFVAVECEMDRLRAQYPATADRWIHDVGRRAHDPDKDGKGMRRIDEAMGGHAFGGCADDRKRYPAAGTTPGLH